MMSHKSIGSFLKRTAVILLVLLMVGFSETQAKTMAFSEDQIKAVYLLNLTGFVAWPEAAFDSADAPLRIAVHDGGGLSSFIQIFKNVIQGESYGRRNIVVDQLSPSADLSAYHMLFVTDSSDPEVARLLQASQGHPILTVGDSRDFCQRGGVINLLRSKNRIGLEVNITAAKAAQLEVSSKLLRIASIVDANGSHVGGQ